MHILVQAYPAGMANVPDRW